jgi:hypothetical protein
MGKHGHTSAKSATALSVISLVLVALGSILVCAETQKISYKAPLAVLAPALAKAQVVILESVGGTTSPAAGNYTYHAETFLTLNASAAEGFYFETWLITSSNTRDGSGNQNTTATNPFTVQCRTGYTYIFQAVFKPVSDKSVQALPLGMTQTQACAVVAFLAVVTVAEATALGIIYSKRQKG